MSEQVTTPQGTEFLVRDWQCPSCHHVQTDTVHPEHGPFFSCTCERCTNQFNEDQLDPVSAERWHDARLTADAYRLIHG